MSTESAVWIESPHGPLFAIVHAPSGAPVRNACVLMLSAGQDSRTGPQRLYLRAARRWAGRGFTVVRIDMPGTGDSVPDNPEIHLDSHATEVVAFGVRYARDVLDAGAIFLVGLCAGARAAIRYATRDPGVSGVVAWSCPTLSEGNTPYLNVRGAVKAVSGRRIFTAAWWRNRWSYGGAEVRQLVAATWDVVRRLWRAPVDEAYFLSCTDEYLADGRPVLFVYGALDKVLCAEFQQRFAAVERSTGAAQAYAVLPGAVHAFSTLEDQRELIDISGAWMGRRLRGRAADVDSPARGDSASGVGSPVLG